MVFGNMGKYSVKFAFKRRKGNQFNIKNNSSGLFVKIVIFFIESAFTITSKNIIICSINGMR